LLEAPVALFPLLTDGFERDHGRGMLVPLQQTSSGGNIH
jgi:hypothetical protein